MDKKELMKTLKVVNLIPVYCHTNLDDYGLSVWPEFLVCRPIEGDYIVDSQGKHLKIVRIKHEKSYSNVIKDDMYHLDIELGK